MTLSCVVAGVVITWVMSIRLIRITGFGEVDLIADPMGIPFTTVARLQVVGRVDQQRRGRLLVPRAPAERFHAGDRTAVILLEPNPPQGFKSREVAEAEWALGGHHPVQELIAVHPDFGGRVPRVYSYP